MPGAPKQLPWAELGLPPYGQLNSDWVVKRGRPAVPEDFTIDDDEPTLAEWLVWLESLADEVAEFLWPRFDAATGMWVGNSVVGAVALTAADLQLMAGLKSQLLQPATARVTNGVLHRVFFAEEDLAPPGANYARYDPAMPADFMTKLPDDILEGVVRVRSLMLMLKQRFQRPRPYQASVLLGKLDFVHLAAKSADTPSLVSGHCLQGAIGGCTAFVKLRPYLDAIDRSEQFLQQLTVDPADRRVFAGVHYPSDNFASWFCALRLCSNFFADDAKDVKAFLWGAIQRSHVFREVKKAIVADPKSPYAALITRLESEAAK